MDLVTEGIEHKLHVLENTAVNHGKFVELSIRINYYDLCLQQHIEPSKEHQDPIKGQRLSQLLKNIIGKAGDVVSQVIKGMMAEEIRAGTVDRYDQDVTSKDQGAIIQMPLVSDWLMWWCC